MTAAGIMTLGALERDELGLRQYRGMNPKFVRQVWAKRRREAGVPMYPEKVWTAEKKAQLLEYINAGLTQGQMGKKFGCSREAIAGVIRHDQMLRDAMHNRRQAS